MNTSIFNYNGNNITFHLGNGDVMVNATEMAKPFSKRVQHFLETNQTQDFIKAYSQSRNIGFENLVVVKKGGNNSGTWMHEDLALEFSRWLSPEFSIWCNVKLKELLKTGQTQIAPQDPLTLLKLAVSEMEKKDKQIAVLQPKADLMERILDTDEKIDIGQASKILELPFGRNTMFKELRERGVFFKNRNEPKQEYIKRGYFQLKEKYITRNNHDGFMVMKVLVTQKGLEYLSQLFNVVAKNKKMALIQ